MHPRITACLLTLPALLLAALPAQAGLLGSPVTVTLSSPNGLEVLNGTTVTGDGNPLDLVNNLPPLSAGASILPGDGSAIGGFMQPAEHIVFGDASVDVIAAAGFADASNVLSTGYASGAAYVFSGFNLPANQVIASASLSVAANGVTNFSPSWLTLSSPTSFSLDLADMRFVGDPRGQSYSNADFTIALTFASLPVPEPASAVLLAAGAAMLWAVCRRAGSLR